MSLEKKHALLDMGGGGRGLEKSLRLSQTPDSLSSLPLDICVPRLHPVALDIVAPAEVILDAPALALAIASGVSGMHVGLTAPSNKSTSAQG